MDQRSEIEHFVIEAIQQVKKEYDDESFFATNPDNQNEDSKYNNENHFDPEKDSNVDSHTNVQSARNVNNKNHSRSGFSYNNRIASGRITTMKNLRAINNKRKLPWEAREKI